MKIKLCLFLYNCHYQVTHCLFNMNCSRKSASFDCRKKTKNKRQPAACSQNIALSINTRTPGWITYLTKSVFTHKLWKVFAASGCSWSFIHPTAGNHQCEIHSHNRNALKWHFMRTAYECFTDFSIVTTIEMQNQNLMGIHKEIWSRIYYYFFFISTCICSSADSPERNLLYSDLHSFSKHAARREYLRCGIICLTHFPSPVQDTK